MLATFISAAAIGLLVGFLSGMLGIGGGTVMVPVFRLVFDMSAVASTATSLFTIIPTSVSGTISHVRNKTCIPRLGVAMGIGGALTSPAGVWLAQVSPSWLVMLAAAAIVGYSAVTMLGKALGEPGAQRGGTPSGAVTAPSTAAVPPSLPRRDLLVGAGIGAAAGIASGYVGLGGGFLMVPLMVAVFGMPMKLASGTSLIAVMILATPAVVVQCILGNVDFVAGIAMACGSIPGAAIGAKLLTRIPERTLKLAFGGFLLVAAILLVVKEFGLLG